MADADAENTTKLTLLTLPYELLALLASWLDIHDLLYSVNRVCKTLYTVANDPVTWARVVVNACTREELLRVVGKFGAYITIIRNVFKRPLQVAAGCPNLRTLELVDSAFEMSDHALPADCTCPLEDVSLFTLTEDLARLCSTTLRRVCTVVPVSAHILTAFSRITHLELNAYFNAYEDPPVLPCLSHLVTSADSLTVSKWTAFVGSHPQLTSLVLRDTHRLPRGEPDNNDGGESSEGVDWANIPMLTNLKFVHLEGHVIRGESEAAFAAALVTASLGLVSAELMGHALPTETLELLAKLPSLTKLYMMSLDKSVDPQTLLLFQNRMEVFSLNDYDENIAMVLPLLGVLPRHLTLESTVPAVYVNYGSQLVNLVSLHMRDIEISAELAACMGEHCIRLRKARFRGVKATRDAALLLSPLFARVNSLQLSHTCGTEFVVVAISRAVRVSSLELMVKSAELVDAFEEALPLWMPRHLVEMRIAYGSLEALRAFAALVSALDLRTRYLSFSLPKLQDMEEVEEAAVLFEDLKGRVALCVRDRVRRM